ncbi:MAG: type IV secretion system DNA-binding domain-containing protein [Candidatus Moranbacteria bacterium]|nr:type IV secretion system DNA-binding domain-containing protein [Candidatus Moranbacteria bacterium]
MSKDINFFAKTNFRNKERVFGIKIDDRRRHVYTIGKTGMGKTNLIQNMAIQDIRDGNGVAVADPHGEFAEECMKAVPASRINDVIYFNPADTDYPIAMNVMEKVGTEYRHLVASGLVGVFKKIWADSWGPRLEYLLRNAILALLEYPTSTLLGVPRILVDKDYREKVVEKVSDPVVKTFWTEEFSKYSNNFATEAVAPIQNKVGQFLSSSLIRNIVGQTKSAFSMREVMDNKKILIMNLSKGRVGEDNSALLGAMMITKIQLSAMARVDMPESERKDFYLYVDEFQNFATESFANILSEARKYRLNLVLAHQYITQLDEQVRDAVLGNVGTIITFRVGAFDAEFLEKEFEPVFYANDLVNLAKYNVYLKLMIDGVSTQPFSATTLPPVEMESTHENLDKIIKVSRERYASPREEVEDKITRWSGFMKAEARSKVKELIKGEQKQEAVPSGRQQSGSGQKQEIPKASGAEKTSQKKEEKVSGKAAKISPEKVPGMDDKGRTLHSTDCSACGAEVKVPFVPDGERPVFCKDCLKEYRRQQSKLQEDSEGKEGRSRAVSNGGNYKRQSSGSHHQSQTNNNKVGEKKEEPGGASLKDLIQKAMKEK